ncbi:MAG TPA: hypothetical protein PKY70_07800 [Nakamurella multipartita]|nr:hypothetical protein [Nakamurella multipartita]
MVVVLDTTDYDVLNVVALKKMATAAAVTQVIAVPAQAVQDAFARLAADGVVFAAGGAALPTDEAEPALRAAAADRYAALRTDPAVLALVDRFETVNAQFLTTISLWQQIDVGGRKVANDHTDAEYDDKIISRIDKLVARLTPLIDALAGHDPRFAGYATRFAAAMAAVDGGQAEFVSSPTLDSVHTVWFEFHEDLLRTLGRERVE